MALPNLVIEGKDDREKELLDRLNEAFPKDADLIRLLDVLMARYYKVLGVSESGKCKKCSSELLIQAFCPLCD